MSVTDYFNHYSSNGYNFSNTILSRYCLSLYSKPFVLLSGISGTGKTKIAQLFKTFDAQSATPAPAVPVTGLGYIILNLTKGILNEDGRGNFGFSDLDAIFETSEIPPINARISQLNAAGDGGNITNPEDFTIETPNGNFKVSVYLQRASSPLLRVRFKSKRGDAHPYDSQTFLNQHYNIGDVLKLQKTGNRQLKVVAVNNTAVQQVNTQLQAQASQLVDNKLFIAVKSNWNDNSELFGYYNVIEEKYYITPFLKFILSAKENPGKPFFLILDEMNLARVEHYFSDYLSCLESRLMNGGVLEQEKVQLHNFPSYIDSNDNYFDLIPSQIEIPNNLYVTGTVNIDETTFTFSPKVLDRANVIEFNEVDLASYGGTSSSSNSFVLTSLPTFGDSVLAKGDDFRNAPQLFKDDVKKLLDVLQPYNLHFGYRVINEMSLFIQNSITFIGNSQSIIDAAIDIQISQKILPKLNGAFGKLDEPIRKLIELLANNNGLNYSNIDIASVNNIDFSQSRFPESLNKLCKLYKNLVFNGFASYLE